MHQNSSRIESAAPYHRASHILEEHWPLYCVQMSKAGIDDPPPSQALLYFASGSVCCGITRDRIGASLTESGDLLYGIVRDPCQQRSL